MHPFDSFSTERYCDSVAVFGFTTTYKDAGTAKIPASRTRWVGNLRITLKRPESLPSSGRIGFRRAAIERHLSLALLQ